MLAAFRNIFKIPDLRKKLLITAGFLILYRVGRYIPLPGINKTKLAELTHTGGGLADVLNQISMLTGGSLSQCTLFALGIMPYISASIIFSLLVKVVPALEALQKEGESGRQKINQYTRYSTIGLCLIQGLFIVMWIKQNQLAYSDDFGFWLLAILSLTTGTIFLMWIGEQITEFGIGNGISLIIMAGIVAALPGALFQFGKNITDAYDLGENVSLEVLKLLVFIALFVGVVVAVVIMHLGQRRIPVQQQKHTRGRKIYGGQRHYLPIRINSAGVMPVIFADSLIILPTALFSQLWPRLSDYLSRGDSFWYFFLYILMVIFFTYFWVSLTFNPVEMAGQMKEYGSFVPGIRPGRKTAEYLETIMNRITFVGALFLCFIGLFPTIVSSALNINLLLARFLGGTGLLIVVGVSLDVVQKVESHLLMRHYEGFMKTGRMRGRRGGVGGI
ncbi:MAG: preprotein translocase subunit SecY [Planctomycetota bacterium]|nr:MAG: preprotein translocase subunit SecY [Planctomycetota bacterium]